MSLWTDFSCASIPAIYCPQHIYPFPSVSSAWDWVSYTNMGGIVSNMLNKFHGQPDTYDKKYAKRSICSIAQR